MRQFTISDHLGHSTILQGDEGLGFQPFDAIKDAGGFVVDKIQDAGGAIKEGAEWVVDKTCAVALDPKFIMATAVAQKVPEGNTQTAAAIAAGTSAVCMVLVDPNGPTIPPPAVTSALPSSLLRMMRQQSFSPNVNQLAPKAPAVPAVPVGSIAAFDPKRGGYRVAIPGPPRLSGLMGLGADFTEVGVSATLPTTARLVDLKTFERDTDTAPPPWFKRPVVLGGIGVGVLLLGAGTYALMRR